MSFAPKRARGRYPGFGLRSSETHLPRRLGLRMTQRVVDADERVSLRRSADDCDPAIPCTGFPPARNSGVRSTNPREMSALVRSQDVVLNSFAAGTVRVGIPAPQDSFSMPVRFASAAE